MGSVIPPASAAVDPSKCAWPCPKCTFLNGADTMLCTICEQGRLHTTTGNGKGKGRAGLRPRSTRCPRATPPPISSFTDSLVEEEAETQDDEDTADGDNFILPAKKPLSKRPGRKVSRVKRTRGTETNVAKDGRPTVPAPPGDETGGSTVAPDAALETVAGAQRHPLELDDSDQEEGTGGNGGILSAREGSDEEEQDDDDGELAGETPSLLGRGWSAKDRRRAEERKQRARERDASRPCDGVEIISEGGGGRRRRGGVTSARRGTKRAQPALPNPSDDVFRARKYEEHTGAEEDDSPLVVRRRGVGTEGGLRPFWRWPPPPPPGESMMDGASSTADSVELCSADSVDATDDGCLHESRPEECHGPTQAEGGAGRGCESGKREAASLSSENDGIAKTSVAATSLGFPAQHGQRPKRRRTKLSLPKCPEDNHPEAASALPAPGDDKALHPASYPTTVGSRVAEEQVEECKEEACDAENAGVSARQPKGGDGGGVPSGASRSKRKEEGSPNREMDEIVLCNKSGIEGSESTDPQEYSADARITVSDEEKYQEGSAADRKVGDWLCDDRAPGSKRRKSPPETRATNDAHRGEDFDESKRGTQGVGEPIVEDGATVGAEAVVLAVASSSRTPNVMPYDMGSDDESSDSDETLEEQAAPGGKPRHLGRAMDEAVESTTARTSSSSPSPSSSSSAAPDAALPTPASPSRTSEAASTEADIVYPIAGLKTPSKKPGGGERLPNCNGSPDPLSIGLVDTPPCTIKREKKQWKTNKTPLSKLKNSRTSREVEMLAETSPSVPATREQWACPRCTLLNRSRALQCEACHIAKPSLVTRLTRRAGGSDNTATGETGENCHDSQCEAAGGFERGGDASNERLPAEDQTAGYYDSVRLDGGDPESWRLEDGARLDSLDGGAKGCSNEGSQEKAFTESVRAAGKNTASDHRVWREDDSASGKRYGGSARGVEVFMGARGALGAGSDKNKCSGIEWKVEGEADEGDFGGNESNNDDDDEDYEDADAIDFDDDTEVICSQIVERFLQSSQNIPRRSASPPPKRQRRGNPPGGVPKEICDLTEVVEDDESTEGEGDTDRHGQKKAGPSGGRQDACPRMKIEEISEDDDEIDYNDNGNIGDDFPAEPGHQRPWAGGDRSGDPSGRRKFRFFASVSEHLDRNSSCMDFAALAATPAGGASGAKSYAARKKARDAKASKSKRGKSKKAKGPSASSRSRGTEGRGSKAKGKGRGAGNEGARGGTTARSFVQPFGGGRGGVPSASWIPTGVATGLSTSAGVKRGRVQRKPFNHYKSNDDLIDDTEVGGGGNWEGAGQINLGGN